MKDSDLDPYLKSHLMQSVAAGRIPEDARIAVRVRGITLFLDEEEAGALLYELLQLNLPR